MTTRVFLSHSSFDSEVAMKIRRWLMDFQFIKDCWIDIRELKPGMEINESIKSGIMKSRIVIVVVSNKSKNSKWVKQEINFASKKRKRLIPILLNVKPEQISPRNLPFQRLIRRKYVVIDPDLFNIYELIPALIPRHHIVDVPLNDNFLVDQSRLIDNLKELARRRNFYILIKHEGFDKSIKDVFEEAVQELWNQDKVDLRKLDILVKNRLPIFWSNTCFVLSRLVTIALSKRMDYTIIADMIHNLIQDLFRSLSSCFFDDVSLSVVNNKKNKKMKQLLIEYSNYVKPRMGLDGGFDGGMYFLCHLYFNDYISPGELVKLTFLGPNIKWQTAFVDGNKYRSLHELYLPASPASEIPDPDWYRIIVPQFLCYEIMAKTRALESFKSRDMDSIGLRLEQYQTVK
jgi:hypothetical protein